MKWRIYKEAVEADEESAIPQSKRLRTSSSRTAMCMKTRMTLGNFSAMTCTERTKHWRNRLTWTTT